MSSVDPHAAQVDDTIAAIKRDVLAALQTWATEGPKTSKQVAEDLGISQPRASNLLCGKLELFSLDMLVNLALRAGLKISLTVAA